MVLVGVRQETADLRIDCGGGVITPGFVDSHTHAVFGTWRAGEYELRYLLDVIDSTGAPVTDGAMRRLADLRAEWAARERELADIVATDIRSINAWAQQNDVEHVPLPQP